MNERSYQNFTLKKVVLLILKYFQVFRSVGYVYHRFFFNVSFQQVFCSVSAKQTLAPNIRHHFCVSFAIDARSSSGFIHIIHILPFQKMIYKGTQQSFLLAELQCNILLHWSDAPDRTPHKIMERFKEVIFVLYRNCVYYFRNKLVIIPNKKPAKTKPMEANLDIQHILKIREIKERVKASHYMIRKIHEENYLVNDILEEGPEKSFCLIWEQNWFQVLQRRAVAFFKLLRLWMVVPLFLFTGSTFSLLYS